MVSQYSRLKKYITTLSFADNSVLALAIQEIRRAKISICPSHPTPKQHIHFFLFLTLLNTNIKKYDYINIVGVRLN